MTKTLALCVALAALFACQSSKANAPLANTPTLKAAPAEVFQRARVPFRLFGQLIIVEVEDPYGAKHSFVLDTGASFSVLDKSVAEAFGAKPYVADDGSVLDKKVSSASGKEVDLGQLQIVPQLKLGSYLLHGEVGVYLADLTPVRYVSGLNVRGIVGFQALQLPFTIDYAAREIILDVPPLEEGAPGVLALQENDALYSPQVILKVGERNGLSLIDTGSGECMALPAPFAETLPYKVKPAVTGFSQNIAGTTEDRSGRLALDVVLGGHTVSEPIVDLIQPDYYRLGGALLRNFTITFDAGHSLVRFARESSEAARCDSVLSIGFYVGRVDDKWIVALLLPGAEKLGINIGDQFLAIGETAITDLERTTIRKLWKSEKEITITLSRKGEELTRVVPVRTMVP